MEAFPLSRVAMDAADPTTPCLSHRPSRPAPERERLLTRALLDLASPEDREPAAHAASLIEYVRLLGGEPAPDAVAVLAGRPPVTAASSPRAELLRELEERLGEGPVRDTLAGAAAEEIPLEDPAAARWPRLAARARELGVLLVSTVPLSDVAYGEDSGGMRPAAPLGALVLYHDVATPWPRERSAPVPALAGAAALHLRHRRTRDHARQLEQALRSRIVIEQAKGVLAERFGCPTDGAFAELRRYARAHQRNLHDLARSVVDGTAPPPFRKEAR
ncbi:ANTAR domain-containing protein [Streptomyces ochraceiscleroticus]|uniref:ANTAR domain-containing protein n=1 Tax=Streptomyces ochraceiscleroticus TaxID=47761 RepID=A0ABW1MTR2_9ACTN|nr:ANTAR domain-containing protein [Streptomyces ochraceiscleroticus]